MTSSLPVVIFDIDGVIADCTERFNDFNLAAEAGNVDWNLLHDSRMDTEPVHLEYVTMVQMLYGLAYVVMLTDRKEKYRERTYNYLVRNQVPHNLLLMRDESTPHLNNKGMWLDRLLEGGHQIVLGVDDAPFHERTYTSRNIPFLYVHRNHYKNGFVIEEKSNEHSTADVS